MHFMHRHYYTKYKVYDCMLFLVCNMVLPFVFERKNNDRFNTQININYRDYNFYVGCIYYYYV